MGVIAWTYGLIGAATVIGAAGFFLVVLRLILLLRKRISPPILPCTWIKGVDTPSSHSYGRVFTLKEMEECCEGFSNLVGETPCNCVYKGILADGTEVAVKRTKKCVSKNVDVERNFHFQVDLLTQIHHQYVANLIGRCMEKHHRMLVFEYAPNGSLYHNLHIDDEHLSWQQRIRVAIGTASAIAYLHHQFGASPIAHGDLTSHTVLLGEDYGAKVCGIGTPRKCSRSCISEGYELSIDGEVNSQGTRGPSHDVYCFGVLLLELISGKWVFSKESGTIVQWASQFLESRDQMNMLVDPTLKNVVPLELYSICEIARLCIQLEAGSRPTMEEVWYMLVHSLGVGMESSASVIDLPMT